jgi:hypothetical protein
MKATRWAIISAIMMLSIYVAGYLVLRSAGYDSSLDQDGFLNEMVAVPGGFGLEYIYMPLLSIEVARGIQIRVGNTRGGFLQWPYSDA